MTEEPKLSEQITDAAIKLVVAGSGGSSLYFLFTDSIPKALIAGVIATGASLLTNFWEGVIGVLKPRSKSLGEAAGKAIDKRLSSLTSQFSNFKELYLESLKTYCYGLEIEGFQDLPGLALKDDLKLRIRKFTNDQKEEFINKCYRTYYVGNSLETTLSKKFE
ncbi:hypothetical protein [Crocosphaera chwakensis]|uniref:Uncharacterized protein n=1 Tax=Crocosphaera chwakensis CCY0110 TaxID=391612 RepID=A3IGX3_9CHRO|nr:hypothetical protein [Crocosphaera chwakensis]EAZ94215.1 hypothetical protein CY0110_10082 [Crocosphaera chwakensis CCY0110]